MQCVHFFFGVGAFVSPLIIDALLTVYDNLDPSSPLTRLTRTSLPFWVLAIIFLPVAVVLLLLPTPEQINGTTLPDEVPRSKTNEEVTTAETKTSSYSMAFYNYFGSNKREREIVSLTGLLLLVYVGAEVSCGGYISTYVQITKLDDEEGGALLTSAYWGAIALGRLIAIYTSLHWSPSKMMIINLIGCTIASVGFLLLVLLYSPPDSMGLSLMTHDAAHTLIWVTTILYGLSMASVFPTGVTLAESMIEVTGKEAAVFVAGAGVGEMLVPLLVAFLLDYASIDSLFYVLLACSILMLLVYFLLLLADKMTLHLKTVAVTLPGIPSLESDVVPLSMFDAKAPVQSGTDSGSDSAGDTKLKKLSKSKAKKVTDIQTLYDIVHTNNEHYLKHQKVEQEIHQDWKVDSPSSSFTDSDSISSISLSNMQSYTAEGFKE